MPHVNQFRTDDETKRDEEELIENEIFLSPIVESALGLENNGRQMDYDLSPSGENSKVTSKVVTRRSSKEELALSVNSQNKLLNIPLNRSTNSRSTLN